MTVPSLRSPQEKLLAVAISMKGSIGVSIFPKEPSLQSMAPLVRSPHA